LDSGPSTLYLSLGSNLGRRADFLSKAVRLLNRNGIRVGKVSAIYETVPVGLRAQPSFLNQVARAQTVLSPKAVIKVFQRIEQTLGRVRFISNAPRTIDIDLLFYNNQVMNTPQLILPHPRIAERAFVLVPLAEIAPQLLHPQTGLSVSEMIEDIDTSGVRLWR
jgi:2-amino-4-hydroxy-6-hydroxymethyldihydropteridine diphosphokinase